MRVRFGTGKPGEETVRSLKPGRTVFILTISALVWGGLAVSAGAQQMGPYCVRCTGPVANYLCSLPQGAAGVPENALKLFCIERASKEQGHAFCSIQKNTVNCPDVRQSFVFSQPVTPEGSGPATDMAHGTGVMPQKPSDGSTAQAKQENSPADAPPETLIEFTSQAAKKAKAGMKNAGKAVNMAVKKTGQGIKGVAEKTGGFIKNVGKTTWKCLGSLFTDCTATAD